MTVAFFQVQNLACLCTEALWPSAPGKSASQPGVPTTSRFRPLAWISPHTSHPLLVVAHSHQDRVCFILLRAPWSCSHGAHPDRIGTPLPSPFSLLHFDSPWSPEYPAILCPRFADFPLFLNVLQPYFLDLNNFHFLLANFVFQILFKIEVELIYNVV